MHSTVFILPLFILSAWSNERCHECHEPPSSKTQPTKSLHEVFPNQINDNETSQVCFAMTITQCETVSLGQDGKQGLGKRSLSALISEAYLHGFDMKQLPIMSHARRTSVISSFSVYGGTLGGSPTGIVRRIYLERGQRDLGQVPVTDPIHGQIPITKRVDKQSTVWTYPTSLPQMTRSIAPGEIPFLKSIVSEESAAAAALSKVAASASIEASMASKVVSSASIKFCRDDDNNKLALCNSAAHTLESDFVLHTSLLAAVLSLCLVLIL